MALNNILYGCGDDVIFLSKYFVLGEKNTNFAD